MRAIAEFFLFFGIGLLLLEPILTFAGASYVTKRDTNSHQTDQDRQDGGKFDYSCVLNVLDSKENPDVLIVGSSVVLWPAIQCDGFGTPSSPGFKLKNWHSYTRSKYLTKLLETKLDRQICLRNIGLPGSSMDDHALIFDVALSQAKRPKLLIVAIHPTQFFATKTVVPEYRGLSRELRSLTRKNQRNSSLEVLKERFYLSVFDQVESAEQIIAESKGGTPKEICYRRTYSNVDGFNRSFEILTQLEQTAKRYDIPLLIVDMPISEKYRNLLQAHLAKYSQKVADICQKNATPYYDLNKMSVEFTREDFADNVHLNQGGARKFYSMIAEFIRSNRNLNRTLCSQLPSSNRTELPSFNRNALLSQSSR